MRSIASNKVEFMAHCELTQEVGHALNVTALTYVGINHVVDYRRTKYSTVKVGGSLNSGLGWIEKLL